MQSFILLKTESIYPSDVVVLKLSLGVYTSACQNIISEKVDFEAEYVDLSSAMTRNGSDCHDSIVHFPSKKTTNI